MKKFVITLFACTLIIVMAASCIGNTSNLSRPISEPSDVSVNINSETYNLKFYVSLMSMGIANWFISTANSENWVQINLTNYCNNEDAHEMRVIKSVSINYPYDFDENTIWKIKIVIDDSLEENPVSPTYVINDIIIKGTDPLIQVDYILGTGYTAVCGQLKRCDQCGK